MVRTGVIVVGSIIVILMRIIGKGWVFLFFVGRGRILRDRVVIGTENLWGRVVENGVRVFRVFSLVPGVIPGPYSVHAIGVEKLKQS